MNTRTLILVLSVLLITALTTTFFFGRAHLKSRDCRNEVEYLQQQLDSLICVAETSTDTVYLTDTIYKTVARRKTNPTFVSTPVDVTVNPDTPAVEQPLNVYTSIEEDSLYTIKDQIFTTGELRDVIREVNIRQQVVTNTIHITDTVTVTTTNTVTVESPPRNAIVLGASYHQFVNPAANITNQLHANVGYQIRSKHQFYLSKSVQDLNSFSVGYNFLIPLR